MFVPLLIHVELGVSSSLDFGVVDVDVEEKEEYCVIIGLYEPRREKLRE